MNAETDSRVHLLAGLLAVLRDVAQARSADLAAYAIVNQSFQLLPYNLALLWRPGELGAGQVTHASGLAKVEADSPFVLWMNSLAAQRVRAHPQARSEAACLGAADFPAPLAAAWDEWLPAHLLWLPLASPADPWPGVLCLARDTPFTPAEQALMQEAAQFYGQTLWGWQRRHRDWRGRLRALWGSRRLRLAALAAVLVLLLPLRLSVVVSGEVVPLAPRVLAAPADAPVRQVLVRPNQAVKAGQTLFTLDDTAVRNRQAVAAKSLEIARADWLRASQRGFADDASRADVAALSARIEEKAAELAFLTELAGRLAITAPADGVVIFSDPLELVGKPVVTGEHIMVLADPAKVALVAWLPPADAIALAPGAEMRLSLYTAPLGSVQAFMEESSYETETTADGISAHRIRGRFAPGAAPQLGLKGTVRLYGERAPLVYHVLRRPLAALRRMSGL